MSKTTIKFSPTATFSTSMLSMLKAAVTALLKANNTVSTLEVKTKLRADYPSYSWYQSDISRAMQYLYDNGTLTYKDNGTFRTYSAVKSSATTTTTTKVAAKKTATKKAASTTATTGTKKNIGKNDALKLIQSTNGKFFGVTFTKKDNTERKMRCRIDPTNTAPNSLGYIKLIDTVDMVAKHINLQTLSEIRINKITYKVR